MIDFVIFIVKCFTLSAATCSGLIPNLSAALTKAEFSIKTSTQLLDLKKSFKCFRQHSNSNFRKAKVDYSQSNT